MKPYFASDPRPEAVDHRVEVAFGRLGEGASARAALDLMRDELDRRQRDLDLRVFKTFDGHEMPDYHTLLTIYAQKHAAWRLLMGLEQRVEASKSAARTLQPHMEAQNAGQ